MNTLGYWNECRIYVDIMTRGKLVAIVDFIFWSIRLSSRRGDEGVKKVDGAYCEFSQLGISLILIIKKLVQHSSNNQSIYSGSRIKQ